MKKRSLVFRKLKNYLLTIFSIIAILFAIGIMLWIIFTVIKNGINAFSWEFFTNSSKPYGSMNMGIGNAVLGTIIISLGASCIAIVPAVLAGVFLSEYKKYHKLASILRFTANIAMGMPSVLIGLFVYMIYVVPTKGFSGFAGSIALAIIMFPVIMRTTEDMLNMTPDTLRESALALGMSKWRTTISIVCRSSKNGLITGILLSLARVSGETAPLLFTAMFADAWPTHYFNQPTANLPVLITEYTTNSPFETMHKMGWGAALIVMLLVLMINIFTRIIFKEKSYGK